MKKIECIIRPEKLKELEDKLNSTVSGLTVTHVKGCGTQKGETQIYRGAPLVVNLLSKIKIEIVLADDKVEEVIALIEKTCRTGSIGDGKIFIYEVLDAIRIRTGERGAEAL